MRTSALMAFAMVLSACSGTDDKSDSTDTVDPGTDVDAGTTDTDPVEPDIVDPPEGDYLDDSAGSELPELDGAALTAAVNQAIADAMYVHGGPAVAGYFEALAQADSSCPQWGEDAGTPFWFDACTTESGATFDGYGYHYEYVGEADGEITWTGLAINTVGTITTPEGVTFEGGGSASYLTGTNEWDQDIWYSVIQPGFAYDGDAAEGTWLADGLDPDMAWYAVRGVDGVGAAATLNGSARVPDGAISALVFSEILLYDEAFGSSCPIEPSGSLSVLDNDGHWVDIYFDGPVWEGPETPAEACDGCGAAWYRGAYLGEACFDFSVLADWQSYPFAPLE